MSKHTPGPWTAEKRKDRKIREWVIRAPGNFPCISYELASISGYDPIHDKPNARLIAAAPDLLEALKAMIEVHGVTQSYADKHIEIPQSWVEVSDLARAAIAKATVEPSCKSLT